MDPREHWLVPYLRLQMRYDARIDRLLREAAEDAERVTRQIAGKQGVGAEVRRLQLTGVQGAIFRALEGFWRSVERNIEAGQAEAQSLALQRSFAQDEEAFLQEAFPDRSTRRAMQRFLLESAERPVEAMIARVFRSRIPLSTQVYQTSALAEGWVDRVVNSGLARGASAIEIAREVRQNVSPNTPGGVSYAAKRLARTEINNAYHAMAIDHNSDKPWVTGMNWALSGSHPAPDICNRIAAASPYDLGSVPEKPHPQCLCYVYPGVVSESQFNDRFLAGEFDDWIDRNLGPDAGSPGRQIAG